MIRAFCDGRRAADATLDSMRTSSRGVAVVLFDEVELLDVASVASVLSAAGRQWNYRPFKIHTAGTRVGLVETRSQVRVESKRALGDLPAAEIVVVPGGYGARRALNDAALLAWLKEAGKAASHVLGVGNGVLLLAAAGLVEDRDVALGRELVDSLRELAPLARPDAQTHFRQSGNLFTASASAHAVDAALALVAAILGEKQARQVAESLGIPAPTEPPRVTLPAQGLTVSIVEKS
jgi:transcriptional regulator GlxA family with amidase domain